ncbi:MAG TPA: helix-turn-helix domain-containing protein, partial [Candidatus Nanopelagicales bacterium]|nr:helix-turn-helix domain-containing protein [Candidatus Nanopelagicales bacterium]
RGSRAVVLIERVLPENGVGARCSIECVLGEVVSTSRMIGSGEIPGLEVCFAHAAPARVDAHEAFFRAPVRWAQPETCLRFPASWFEVPLPGRDPNMVQYFERQADALLARLPSTKTTSHDVVQVILAALPGSDASVEHVARRLSMSPRTLRRRLSEEETTFERLLQETRAQLADRYLARMDLSLAEIAQLLGYSDQSAFQRAFARWKGETPRSFRLALRGAQREQA